MKLRVKMLLGFGILIVIIVGVGIYNLLFLQNTSATYDNIVEKKIGSDKIIQDTNILVMKIYSDSYDSLLLREMEVEAKKMKKNDVLKDADKVYENIKDLKELLLEKNDIFDDLKTTFRYYIQFGIILSPFSLQTI